MNLVFLSIFNDPGFLGSFIGSVITGLIAVIGVIASFLSVRKIGLQIEIQKQQWEFSHKPIFRIAKLPLNSEWLLLKNEKDNFFVIEEVSFTTEDIKVNYNGFLGYQESKTRNGEKTVGDYQIVVPLKIQYTEYSGYFEGVIRIRGFDFLGNQFIANSPTLKFKNKRLINDLELTHAFFKTL